MRKSYKKLFRDTTCIEKFLTLYKQGFPIYHMATKLKCNHTSLLYQIKKLKIKRDDKRTIAELFPTAYQITKPPKPPKPPKHPELYNKTISRCKLYKDYLREAGLELKKGSMWGDYAKIKKELPVRTSQQEPRL